MPHQVALTVVAPLRAGARPQLDEALAAAAVPFGQLAGVHFARMFVLDEGLAADGSKTSAKLVWMSDVDAPLDRHLGELSQLAVLDRLFCNCDGYPDAPDAGARRAFLEAHAVPAATAYVNTVGRGLDQVLLERRLREAIEGHLDAHPELLNSRDSVAIREAIRDFVAGDESLSRALTPAEPTEAGFRRAEKLHMVLVPVLLVVLLPVILVALPFYAVALRIHEKRDLPDARPPDDRHAEQLAAREDHSIQNPFIAAGSIKPGRFRLLTTMGVLWIADYAVRHIFNRADLAGVKTIHFARWVFLDERRRVVFASSYDGSVESYMDDFIDKVWWGLNAVFSNGVGYPRTRWLLFGGARDERAFKRVLRRRQEPVQLFYSAYQDMTALNLQNNQELRAGLIGTMTERQATEWLARL
ncbi:MAG TPA: hypothetical protein VGP67_04175 [Gaiellales bacterium]|nr:hypothetical protein [Gaiellales bacterium]